jgi:hypothetical protein
LVATYSHAIESTTLFTVAACVISNNESMILILVVTGFHAALIEAGL